MPVKGGRVTAGFRDARPLSNPGEHIHGALDIAGGEGIIRAPCSGAARGYAIFRREGFSFGPGEKAEILGLPFAHYYEDIFGAFVAIEESGSRRLHLLCHIWPAAILNVSTRRPFSFDGYIESASTERFSAHILVTTKRDVVEGEVLAPVGNAGFSTGVHVHWEIHRQCGQLDPYEKRINPEDYI